MKVKADLTSSEYRTLHLILNKAKKAANEKLTGVTIDSLKNGSYQEHNFYHRQVESVKSIKDKLLNK